MSSNVDELYTWGKAAETGTEELFAEILTHAHDGSWLVMEQCVPIYPSKRKVMKCRDAVYDRETLRSFVSDLTQAGWTDPDWKHGNCGYTDDGRVVLLDYGTGSKLCDR